MVALQRRHRATKILPLLLLVLLALSACQGLGGEPVIVATIPPQEALTGGDQEIAATMLLGGDTWTANCADCHGRLGEGTADGAPLPDLSALTEDQILASVTNGVAVTDSGKEMPAFSDRLSAEELLAVATYASMISLARERNMIDTAGAGADTAQVPPPATTEEPAVVSDLPTTSDPSVIQIQRATSQVEVLDGLLYVLQIVQFVNTSESVFQVLDESAHTSVGVNIPAGAQVQDLGESTYQLSPDGTRLNDVQPVFPGEPHTMHLAYALPYGDEQTTAGLVINQTFDYALTGPVDVLLATDGLTLTAETLAARDSRSSNGVTIWRYGADLSLPANSSLSFTITGVPVAPAPADTSADAAQTTTSSGSTPSPLAYMLVGAGVSALLIAGGLYLRERLVASKSSANASIEQLMDQIADLDTRHQAGQIKTEAYNRQRSSLKSRLAVLMSAQAPRRP